VRDEDIIDMDAYCDQSYWIDPATGEKHHLTPELFIAGSSWQFAKTMAHMPHEYTVRDLDGMGRRSTCMDHETFEWFARFIRHRGYPGWFGKTKYMYYDVDGFKYWTMGSPIAITTILNRARLEPEKVDPIFAQRLLS
jgi:hypothetical protein